MSKLVESVALGGAALLLAPLLAAAGIAEVDAPRPLHADAAPRQSSKGLVLRCWQDGRLILAERGIQLPAGIGPSAAKLQLLDSKGWPVYLLEMKCATCLIQAEVPTPGGSVTE
jgi:hypothetical protein